MEKRGRKETKKKKRKMQHKKITDVRQAEI